MKKLILILTLAAFASSMALQAEVVSAPTTVVAVKHHKKHHKKHKKHKKKKTTAPTS